MKPSPIRSFVRLDIRDQIRDRGALLSRLGPTLIFVLGMTFAVISGLGSDTDLDDQRTVTVDGPLPAGLEDALESRRLEILDLAPLDETVRSGGAQAGLVRGRDGDFTVLMRSDDPGSAHTARRVRAALAEWDASANPRPTDFPFETVETEPEMGKVRRLVSFAIPSALVFLLGGAFGSSAMQWHETKRSGALIHQLTLPVSRESLVMAKTAAEAVLSLVAASPMVALMGLATAAVVADGSGTVAAGGAVLLLVSVSVIVVAMFALGGLVAVLRNPEKVNQGAVTIGPLFIGAGLFMLYAITDGDVPGWLGVVPIVGAVDVVRQAVVGGFTVTSAAMALASSAAATLLMIRSVRSAPTDDLGLRAK